MVFLLPALHNRSSGLTKELCVSGAGWAVGAAPSPRPPLQQNLCQGLHSWGSGRLPGNWPHSALLAQEKQSLGMAHLLPCTWERWLWRCFLHRNITAAFLQLSAVTNGSLSILNNILNNCGFFGSICSVILPDLKQLCSSTVWWIWSKLCFCSADRAGASVSVCFALHLWA